MGILVPQAILPMGITVSNVYMSFTGEVIHVQPVRGSSIFITNSIYKVYKDQSKSPDTSIRIPISVSVNDIQNRDVYSILYEELKKLYPDSEDVIDNPVPPTGPPENPDSPLSKVSEPIQTEIENSINLHP